MRRIGVVEKNRAEYWDRLNHGLLQAARRRGFEATISAPEFEDVEAQRQLMIEQLDSGVDALLFVATHPEAFADVVERALEGGVPVLTMDLDGYHSSRLFHVGTYPFDELGRAAAETLLPLLRTDGPVIAQAGSTAPGAAGKLAGFVKHMECVGRRVVLLPPDHERLDEADRNFRAALETYPHVAGVYGVYAYHPIVQAEVLRESGREPGAVPVVGFDMLAGTVEGLRQGMISASIWIREHGIGGAAAVVADLFASLPWDQAMTVLGGDLQDRADNVRRLPVSTFTPENVEAYVDWLREVELVTP